MTQINFGVGTMIGVRTDITLAQPSFMGILQNVELDFDTTLKELVGQYKFPVDVAPANMKITGKASFAQIQSGIMNNMFFGMTAATASGFQMALAEPATIPATPFQVTVTNAATFKTDLGVFDPATGSQYKPVAAAPAAGQYSVNTATGIYTFAAADTGKSVVIYYKYTVTTLNQISLSNPLMGTGPIFQLFLKEQYTNNIGVTNNLVIQLNACRSSKLTLPFKNADYTIMEFDFEAYADASNNVGLIATTE